MASLSSLNFRLTANIAPFRKGLNKAGRAMDKTGRKMQQFGKNMSAKVTAPIVALGAASFSVFKDFQLEMAKVQAVSGATGEEFKSLSDNAKELGRSTIFSAREVAGLQLEFAKLGFTAKQITGVTEATLNLAQASGTDLARAAEVTGATLRGFGLDVSETSRVSDVMAKSFASSSLDMEAFAESMKYVAPVAESAGISLEETTAMLGALANVGIKGSQAGTSLRRIISELGASGKPTSEALRELANEGLNLADAKDEVGRSAQSALLKLTSQLDVIEDLDNKFENAAGSAKSMADIMDMTAAGATKALGSAVEGLAIEFGGLVSVALTPFIKKLTQMATFINELSPRTKKFIAIIAGIAAVIGPAVFILGSMTRALTALRAATILQTIATTALGVAVNILTSPITLIVGLIAALAAGVIYVAYNFEAFSATAKNAIAKLVNAVIPKVNALIGAFNEAAEFFGRDKIMVEPFKKMKETAVPAFKSVGQVVTEVKKDLGLFKEETEETTESLGKLEGQVEDLNQDLGNGTGKLTEYEKAMKRVNERSKFYASMRQVSAFDTSPFEEEFDDNFEAEDFEPEGGFENIRKGYAKTKLAAMELADGISQAMSRAAGDTIAGMGEIAGAIMVGEASFKDLGNFMLSQFANLLSQLGKMFIEYGIALKGFQMATITMNPALAIAAGVALTAVAGGIKAHMAKMAEGSIPALAEGGIVTGPTLALIGEGKESEAVIPLSKLNTMMQGGSQQVEVVGRISGADILLSNERAQRNRTRQRGF